MKTFCVRHKCTAPSRRSRHLTMTTKIGYRRRRWAGRRESGSVLVYLRSYTTNNSMGGMQNLGTSEGCSRAHEEIQRPMTDFDNVVLHLQIQ